MATIYVDSNATGANDGTSFTDAYTAISSANTAAAQDIVLVASDHSESIANPQIGNASLVGPVVTFISVNSTTENYATGASITASSGDLDVVNAHVIGFDLDSGTSQIEAIANTQSCTLEDCTLAGDQINAGTIGQLRLIDCTATFTDITSSINGNAGGVYIWGGSISNSTASGSTDAIFAQGFGSIEAFGCDFSGCTCGRIVSFVQDRASRVKLAGCRLNANHVDTVEDNGEHNVEVINCTTGTSTDPILDYFGSTFEGECLSDTAVTRTDGASDGTTSYTMSLEAKASRTQKLGSSAYGPLSGIQIWVPDDATNLRLYVAHNAVGSGTAGALQDDECWITYQGPSQLGSATSQLVYLTSKPTFGATATDLTTDSSTWSGTGVGTEQRIDLTIAPTIAGYATVWLHLATGSGRAVTIHFDPKLEVT